jgi:hypothetical protein
MIKHPKKVLHFFTQVRILLKFKTGVVNDRNTCDGMTSGIRGAQRTMKLPRLSFQ